MPKITSRFRFFKKTASRPLYPLFQGPGIQFGHISSYVVAVKLVDGDGEIQMCGPHDPEMSAIRACLGLCGIIYEITFQVKAFMYLHPISGTTKIGQLTVSTSVDSWFTFVSG